MAAWVYVLRSEKAGQHYVGVTAHLQQRISRHNNGQTPSTRSGVPWRLVYRERCPDHAHAREREKLLKSGQGREFLNSLESSASQPACGG